MQTTAKLKPKINLQWSSVSEVTKSYEKSCEILALRSKKNSGEAAGEKIDLFAAGPLLVHL